MASFSRWCCLVLLWAITAVAYGADPTVSGYELKSSRRAADSDAFVIYTYAAKLSNPGQPLRSVVATLRSANPAVTVIDGSLAFGDVPSGATVTGIGTFSVRRRPSLPLRDADFVWSINGTPGAAIWAGFNVTATSGYAPLTVRFTPAALTDSAIVQYRWDLNGDGVVDVSETLGREQSYTYSSPGTYKVALTVRDSKGLTDTRTVSIVVGNAPPVVASASASPTNGAAPLNVFFSVSASDSDGVVRYEWDFDGDGTYDKTIDSSYGNVSVTYNKAGIYNARVRLTDRFGASTVFSAPTTQVRAGAVGSPQVALSVGNTSGNAPLTTTLSASVSDPLGKTVKSYEWDAASDGTYESSTTVNSTNTTYSGGGTYYARVRVTMSDGRQAEDVKLVTVASGFQLAMSGDTLDAQLAQSVVASTTLGGATRVSLVVERRSGGVVRTLVPMTQRPAGNYRDTWDGRDDAGAMVAEGVYLFVLLYVRDGVTQRLDLSTSTGGDSISPTRTPIASTFEPYNGKPLVTDFSLTRAAEVTAFIGSFNVDTRYVTFFSRRPFGRGTHRITWQGDSSTGQILSPAPGDSFLFGLQAYTLPNNGVFVRNGVQVAGVQTSPPVYDPTEHTASGTYGRCSIQFDLNVAANAEIEVRDATTGVVVSRLSVPHLSAGTNTVLWDGKAIDGRYVAPGTYRVSVTATQANGYRSLSSYALQRVFY